MPELEQDKIVQLLTSTQQLSKSSELTTLTIGKIKDINHSLVEVSQEQYDVVNDVFAKGEKIKSMLSESVNKADESLLTLNNTVRNMESEFSRIQESIHLFDKIRDSTLALNNVARHTKMLALNTSVLGGSLGVDGRGINIVAQEMQELVKTCENTSKHIDNAVSSAKDSLQELIDVNQNHIQESLENTSSVESALKTLISVVKGNHDEDAENKPSVDSILSAVGGIEQLADQVRHIVSNTQSETTELYNSIEISNQVVSDLIGVLSNQSITNLSAKQVYNQLNDFRIIDVRRKDEFTDQLGHIQNAKLFNLNDLQFKDKLNSLNKNLNYLFVCRSGGRSSKAARIAQGLGFQHIFNLEGGMLSWKNFNLPIDKQ